MTARDSFVRAHLLASLVLTSLTAVGSYAYFHIDEYFQVLELARFRLGLVDAWSLPWEHAERMRPWLQPGLYVVVGKILGPLAGDPFVLGLACRLVTGLLSWVALASFVRATIPFVEADDARRLHVRILTLAGFLPYLFVRTSSETLSMAALAAAAAVLLAACAPRAPHVFGGTVRRVFASGVLFGVAFEARFQTAIVAISAFGWLAVVGRARARALAAFVLGGVMVVGLSAIVDAWGYGAPAFPALSYARTNLLEGAAALFGADPPFAYLWLSPANVMAPLVVVMIVLVPLAWLRRPRHPLTWMTMPFVLVHNLLSHKEERFLFPVAVLVTGLVVLAIAPEGSERLRTVSDRIWAERRGLLARGLAIWSCAGAALLALWPVGWHHHVRFTRHAREVFGDEMHVAALPDFDLGLPAYHPRVYDVEKLPAEELARRLDAGTARAWLVADSPRLVTAVPSLDARATLVWSELPLWDDPVWNARFSALASAYDAHAKPPLRPLRFRSLYRLDPATPPVH